MSVHPQVHPVFFDRTSTVVHTLEKHGTEVKDAGWYNLGRKGKY